MPAPWAPSGTMFVFLALVRQHAAPLVNRDVSTKANLKTEPHSQPPPWQPRALATSALKSSRTCLGLTRTSDWERNDGGVNGPRPWRKF
jgi:hypothetical protein